MADVPRSTRALLDLLEHAVPGPALDIGSFGGAVAEALGCTYVHTDLTACGRAAGAAGEVHTDTLPDDGGPYQTISFDAREYEPGHAAELVARAAASLGPGGVLLTTARREDVAPYFESVEAGGGEALVARGPVRGAGAEIAWTEYEAEFGGQVFHMRTAPGIFSPRRLDEGTRVMLGQVRAEPGARFLDLGCGAGIVSRIATDLWQCQVTAVDVNARALRVTALNAPGAEVIASDGFRHLGDREFDIIASNPPYHTDFAVGKAFIEGAFAHLAMGGTLYLVVKRADWYVQKVRSVFGGLRVVQEHDYTVVIAQKRPPREKAAKPAAASATTKKHAKRMAATKKKPGQ